MPVYVLVSQEKSDVIIITTDVGYVLPILGSKEIAAEHLPHYLVPVQIKEIATFQVLRSFVEHLVGNAKTDRKTFILYDTIQAGERVTSPIPVEEFLAAIRS